MAPEPPQPQPQPGQPGTNARFNQAQQAWRVRTARMGPVQSFFFLLASLAIGLLLVLALLPLLLLAALIGLVALAWFRLKRWLARGPSNAGRRNVRVRTPRA